ncbi:MAG TPA: MarR family transcriptional regulator [Acidimicrobiia bacterium]|nr:MarR family transcriptional regulator [Acidimicrobiia bacterium]
MSSSARPAVSEVADVAGRLRISATRLARRLRQESDAGLTPSQLSALAAIERHGSLTLGQLAEYERVAPASVTKVLAKLEAEGLVSRRTDEHDRRSSWVTLTGTGRRRIARIRRRKRLWLAARIESLDPEQRARLADALDVLDALTADAP